MPSVQQRYGKANVRLLRVQRLADRHEVREVRVGVSLDGEFERAYTAADNSRVVPTDTIKNLVQVLGLEYLDSANEPFVLAIAHRLLERYAQVSEARVELEETPWSRMAIDGRPHPHGFVRAEGGRPFAEVTATRSSRELSAGFRDCAIMKTTASGFVGYVQDEYTTLAPTTDRILATRLDVRWRFDATTAAGATDWAGVAATVRAALLRVFATTFSHSVQDSLYRMGEAALAAAPDIMEITLSMPNVHYLPIDLSPFELEPQGRLFLPTDEPSGQIAATLRRE